tara:strand:+ start:5149 stop:6540 length:1392 start_codon:yes stop_codon:yes gene_type:complete
MGQEEVKKALKKSGSWLLSNEIAKASGSSLKSIQSSLRRLVKWGEIKKEPASKVIKGSGRLKEKSFAGFAYKIKDYKTLDDLKLKNKTVLLRLDLNSKYRPLFTPTENFSNHLPTILELIEKQAKIVILTHQSPETNSLQPHAAYLTKKLNQKVTYIEDILGKEAQEKIQNLHPKEVLLLKNLFSLKEELHSKQKKQKKTKLVQTLSKLADCYVNDSFSLAHLDYASLTGFPLTLTSAVGRYFEKEIEFANHLLKPSQPCIYLLGGNKPIQLLPFMKKSLEKDRVDLILTSGLISHLLHIAKGYKLGGQEHDLKQNKFKVTSEIKKLAKTTNIVLPKDYSISTFGVRENISLNHLPIYQSLQEIGKETLENYVSMIKKAKTILIKGTFGKIESPEFQESTRALLEEISKSDAFTFVLGTSTVNAFKEFNIPIKKLNHLSKNSQPLLTYLSEKPLPGLEVLKVK